MTTKEFAYRKILSLAERFKEQYDSYKDCRYNETLTRHNFIGPLFKAYSFKIVPCCESLFY